MTHEFKPGDIVRAKATVRIDAITDTGLLKFENHNIFYGEPDLYELVEPSITHRELRQVFLEHLQTPEPGTPHNSQMMAMHIGNNDGLRAVFEALTGEQL